MSVQKPEDEILLRTVLFDAVLLVEYPFLYQNATHIKNLTLTRLITTHEAVEYFRYDKLVIVLCVLHSLARTRTYIIPISLFNI